MNCVVISALHVRPYEGGLYKLGPVLCQGSTIDHFAGMCVAKHTVIVIPIVLTTSRDVSLSVWRSCYTHRR